MIKSKKHEYLIISILPIVMLIYSIYLILRKENIEIFINNLINIFQANDILLTDYFYLSSSEVAIFNASIVGLINIFILYKMDMKINGLNIAAIFQMFGFAFMGKNIINIIPFYIGGYLYSYIENKPYKSVIISTMFSTGLAPVVSSFTHFFNFSILGIFLSIIVGIFLGFIIPPIASHVLQIHGGYSLYNTGFAAGIIAITLYSILRLANIDITPNNKFVTSMDYTIVIILCIIYTFYIIYGFMKSNYSFKQYFKLIERSGRLVSDFTVTDGFPTVVINMGLLGFFCIFIIFLFFPMINGPILAGMFSIIAFAGFGKHIKNIFPIILGVLLAYFTIGFDDISLTSFGVTLFFSTSLAPISGKFGTIPGIIAGFCNFCLVSNIGSAHAGLNLYNTGLASGILAGTFVPLLQIFEKNN